MRKTSTALTVCAALALTACGAQAGPAAAAPVAAAPAGTAAQASPTAAAPSSASPTASAAAPTAATTAPASAVRDGRLAVGDSVMLGSRPRLKKRGFRVDATVSRQFGAAVGIVRRGSDARTLPRNVVVHLGTNGTITVKACRAIVRHAGAARRVFLVNIRVPRPWQNSNNRALRTCDAAFSASRVHVVDWYAHSAGHPAWFRSDRVHPSPVGQARYTKLIDRAVDAYGL
jgi:hypothetical protein